MVSKAGPSSCRASADSKSKRASGPRIPDYDNPRGMLDNPRAFRAALLVFLPEESTSQVPGPVQDPRPFEENVS